VLQQLSDQVRECLRRAADAKAQADAITDQALKNSYSELESSWLFLARSYMLTESLQDFVGQRRQEKELAKVDPKLPLVGQLFDLLPVAVYVCDASGLIIYYNSHAAKLWGRPPSLNDPTDRFCGSYRMYHLDGGPIERPDCPMAEVLRSGEPVQNREIVVERADGSRAVVLTNINPFKDHRGKVLGAVTCFQDLTERKRNERQITALTGEAEQPAKNILSIPPVGRLLARPTSAPSDLRVALNHAWSTTAQIDLEGTILMEQAAATVANLIRYRVPEYPKVLDVGCAGGTLAGELPPSVHYLGIDASESAIEAAQSLWGGDDILFNARDIREFDPVGNWDAIVFSEALSHLAVHEAIAEVRRYAKALSPEGIIAFSMMNDEKSRAIWRALREEFRWIDGIHWQQKEPWPSDRISVSRGHPGYLVGVLQVRHKL
jgi:PAS domain-containing protein/SAM-dependent methyltransferase